LPPAPAALIPKKRRLPAPPPPPSRPLPAPADSSSHDAFFPPTGASSYLLQSTLWDSRLAASSLTLPLPGYSRAGILQSTSPNTLAIEFSARASSPRFALSIAGAPKPPATDKFEDNTLFHVNPRQNWKGGQVVINNQQQGSWGRVIAVPNEMFPKLFGVAKSLMVIQVRSEGWDLFVHQPPPRPKGNPRLMDGTTLLHCYRFEHRSPLPPQDGFL
jgi:hypothetical protein